MSSFIIKDTLFVLPSEGKAYTGTDVKLINGDSVRIRPFVAADQKVLAGSGSDSYRVYHNILSKILVEPKGLDTDKLLLSDVNSILFAVRIMTYGEDYSIQYKCSNCGAQNTPVLSLMDVPVIYARDMDDFSSEQQLIFPGGDTVSFHLPTLGDERIAANMVANMKKMQGSSINVDIEKAFARIACLIDSVNDEAVASNMQKMDYLNKMPGGQYNDLVDAISSKDCGISPTVELECSACQWMEDIRLGITAEFFRPTKRRG